MFKTIHEGGAPIKAWIEGVPLEDAARTQLINAAALPFIHEHIAVMPDVHFGRGATVGSVIPTRGAIVRWLSSALLFVLGIGRRILRQRFRCYLSLL